ncbi:hypothetical protein AURDEDRAFT_177181 [Auricularia subglabra TFB-10046 SS5]|uniref:Uncharacterized protein n=1 Tax=Auricularia subglabra (strain TFB-10046 / SS5) TaxID=717982 RepID=J0D4Q5_AURST|nr:hypothetical protein AURDEDRAFT_177181 [Auricularia subglabra TFB-10046 SS5]
MGARSIWDAGYLRPALTHFAHPAAVARDTSSQEIWIGRIENADQASFHGLFLTGTGPDFYFVSAHRWYKMQRWPNFKNATMDQVEAQYARLQKNHHMLEFWKKGRQQSQEAVAPRRRSAVPSFARDSSLFGVDDDDELKDSLRKRREKELGEEGDLDDTKLQEEEPPTNQPTGLEPTATPPPSGSKAAKTSTASQQQKSGSTPKAQSKEPSRATSPSVPHAKSPAAPPGSGSSLLAQRASPGLVSPNEPEAAGAARTTSPLATVDVRREEAKRVPARPVRMSSIQSYKRNRHYMNIPNDETGHGRDSAQRERESITQRVVSADLERVWCRG